jgi:uncharacterized protein YjlB
MAQSRGYGAVHSYNAPLGTDTFVFDDDGFIPNNTLPLIIRRRAIQPSAPDHARAFENVFWRHGWSNAWRNGIYDYHHYHSTAHEVLGIACGSGTVRFGGERGETVGVSAGDVVVIPAGVGHALIHASHGFLVVGSYADGRDCDVLVDDPKVIAAARERIRQVPLPDADPVDGPDGPLMKLWSSGR